MQNPHLEAAFEALKKLQLSDFILPTRPLPSESITSIEQLVDSYTKGDDTTRQRIVEQVGVSFAFVFQRYARCASVEAVRRNDPELLGRAPVALAIENAKVDWRDTLPYLALIYNSARKLGIDPIALFRSIARISQPSFRCLVESFLSLDESRRTVDSFHYVESGQGAAFDYVYSNPLSSTQKTGHKKTGTDGTNPIT